MDGGGERKGLFPGLSKPFGRGCGRGMGLGDEIDGMDGVSGGVGRYGGDIMVYGNTVSLDCM